VGLLPGRPFAGVLGQPQANSGGSALAQGEADGALYANTQNLGATIPVSPWGGRISLAGSRSVAVGNLFGQPGADGPSAAGQGSASIQNGQVDALAKTDADAETGLAIGNAYGIAIDLPLLGIKETIGDSSSVAIGK